MMNRLDWTWEMRGDGPHYFLDLRFEETSAERMHERALELLPNEFERHSASDGFQRWYSQGGSEWSYLEVALFPSQLYVTRGWGYSRGGEEDFHFLERLFEVGDLNLQRWRVQAGGDGYAQIYLDSGTETDSFFGYCHHQEKQRAAPVEEVAVTLQTLLNAPDLRGLYTLGERSEANASVQWPVQFIAPMINQPWENAGYREELTLHSRNFERLAEDVSDICHVRTSKSGFAVEKETHLMRGGTINISGSINRRGRINMKREISLWSVLWSLLAKR